MKTFRRTVAASAAACGLMSLVLAVASAETFPLKLKRADTLNDAYCRRASPQQFFMQLGVKDQERPGTAGFSDVVNKEPAQYNAEEQLRGVAKLGSKRIGLVLDSSEVESKQYNRLYFDINQNGDLTDDKPIDGEPTGQAAGGNWWCQFPRVDLTIDVDGAKVDYAFFFTAGTGWAGYGGGAILSGRSQYVTATLRAACYLEGEIQLNGKTRRVVLLDFNSNGRFDDKGTVRTVSRGRAYPGYGDLMFIDPDAQVLSFNSYDLLGAQLGKAVPIDGELYDVSITPASDKLTVTGYAGPAGRVSVPCDGFTAVVYGDAGFSKISGDKSATVKMPAGDWRLMYYTIERPQEPESSGDQSGSLLSMLAAALTSAGPRSRVSTLTAYPAADTKAIAVRDGETVELPFGGPFRPVVTASAPIRGDQTIKLGLALIGAGGEVCRGLTVAGKRPPKPEFTITTAEGEEVAAGSFEYG
jgi:hypothetical protein